MAGAVGDAVRRGAKVWVADGRATALGGRRIAGGRGIEGREGEVMEVDIGTTGRLAREIAGYGAGAVVLEPASLREEVLDRLRAHAGDQGSGAYDTRRRRCRA